MKNEKQIEDFLYENYWLVSEDIVPVQNIMGNKVNGVSLPGRQIKVSDGNSEGALDLLFKCKFTNRPVIVEVKSTRIDTKHIGQVSKYGYYFRNLDDSLKAIFQKEFGYQLSNPRFIIIGESISDEAKAAANLIGIELRLYSGKIIEKINPKVWLDSVKEWKNLTSKGEFPSLSNRHKFADRMWEVLYEACRAVLGSDAEEPSYSWTNWFGYTNPFCEFSVRYDDHWIFGCFEFAPEDTNYNFNSKYWWFVINCFDYKDIKNIEKRLNNDGLGYKYDETQEAFISNVPKTLFKESEQKNCLNEFKRHLRLAKELYEQNKV